jgi:hypothetical protein
MKLFKGVMEKVVAVTSILALVFQPIHAIDPSTWQSSFGGLTQIFEYQNGMMSDVYDAVGDKTTILRDGKQWQTVYKGTDGSEVVSTQYTYDASGNTLYITDLTNNTRTSYDNGSGVSAGSAQYDQTYTAITDANGNTTMGWVNTAKYDYNSDGSMSAKEIYGNVGSSSVNPGNNNSNNWVDGKDDGMVVTQKVLFSNGQQQEVVQYWGEVPVPQTDSSGNVEKDSNGNTVYQTDSNGDVMQWQKGDGTMVQKFLYNGSAMVAAVSYDSSGDATNATIYEDGKEAYSLKLASGQSVSMDQDGSVTISGTKFDASALTNGVEVNDSNGNVLAWVQTQDVYEGAKEVAQVSYGTDSTSNISGEFDSSGEITNSINEFPVTLSLTTNGSSSLTALDGYSACNDSSGNSVTLPDIEAALGMSVSQKSAAISQWAVSQLEQQLITSGGVAYNGSTNKVLTNSGTVYDFSKATVGKDSNGNWELQGVQTYGTDYGQKTNVTYMDNHGRQDHSVAYTYSTAGGVQSVSLTQKWEYNDTGTTQKPNYQTQSSTILDTTASPVTVDSNGNTIPSSYAISLLGQTMYLPVDVPMDPTDPNLNQASAANNTSSSQVPYVLDANGNPCINIQTMHQAMATLATNINSSADQSNATQLQNDQNALNNDRAELSGAIDKYLSTYLAANQSKFSMFSSVTVGNINIGTVEATAPATTATTNSLSSDTINFNISDNIGYQSGAMMYSVNYTPGSNDTQYATITYYNNNGQQKATYDYSGGTVANGNLLNSQNIIASLAANTNPITSTQLTMQNGNVYMSMSMSDFMQQAYNTLTQEAASSSWGGVPWKYDALQEFQASVAAGGSPYSASLLTHMNIDTSSTQNTVEVQVLPAGGDAGLNLTLMQDAYYNGSPANTTGSNTVNVQWNSTAFNDSTDGNSFVVTADKVF